MGVIIGANQGKKQCFFIVLQRAAVNGNSVDCAVAIAKPFGVENFFDILYG